VAAALAGASLPVVLVNPARVRHFAQALGRRAKTVPIDAGMIARFVEATKPDCVNCTMRPRNCSSTSSRGTARSLK
jgi:transposase